MPTNGTILSSGWRTSFRSTSVTTTSPHRIDGVASKTQRTDGRAEDASVDDLPGIEHVETPEAAVDYVENSASR